MLKRLLALAALFSLPAFAQSADIQGGMQVKQPAYPSSTPGICALSIGSSASGQACLFGALGSTNYNPLVQANDSGLIFNAGSSASGNFFLGPHSGSSVGLRMTYLGALTLTGANFQANNGLVVKSGYSGNSANQTALIGSSDSTSQAFIFYNNLTSGTANGLVQNGDQAIISGTSAAGLAFVLGPKASGSAGLRFDSSGNITTGGATGFDLSGSTGAFKTSTGTVTIGGSASQTQTQGSVVAISAPYATKGDGYINSASRVVERLMGGVADCAGAALAASVSQVLDGFIFIDSSAAGCTITLPTWQGSSGIVQALPSSTAVAVAVGNVVHFHVTADAGAVTIAAGTGGTMTGAAVVAAGSARDFYCRITSVTSGSETATCY